MIGKKKSLNLKNTLVQNMTVDVLSHDLPKHESMLLIDVLETLECLQFYAPPLCTGHRCPFGVCLPEKHVCDGVVQCHDGSDEAADLCVGRTKRSCGNNELTCGNGKCVDKSQFCDQMNDCGDLTDEPPVCSCYEYLKLVSSLVDSKFVTLLLISIPKERQILTRYVTACEIAWTSLTRTMTSVDARLTGSDVACKSSPLLDINSF